MLQTALDFVVVGVAQDGPTALALVDQLTPDLVIIEMHLPGFEAIAAAPAIRSHHPEAQVLVLDVNSDPYRIQAVLVAGASAYLQQQAPARELHQLIRYLHRHSPPPLPSRPSPLIAHHGLGRLVTPPPIPPPARKLQHLPHTLLAPQLKPIPIASLTVKSIPSPSPFVPIPLPSQRSWFEKWLFGHADTPYPQAPDIESDIESERESGLEFNRALNGEPNLAQLLDLDLDPAPALDPELNFNPDLDLDLAFDLPFTSGSRSNSISKSPAASRSHAAQTQVPALKSGSHPRPIRWPLYATLGGLGCLLLWGTGLLYLGLTKPQYTSTWTVAIAPSAPGDALVGGRPSPDPRLDYQRLVQTPTILEPAAATLGIPVAQFGIPRTTLPAQSPAIEFSIRGNTALEAQQKAQALQQVLMTQSQSGLAPTGGGNLPPALSPPQAKQALKAAQAKLATFQSQGPVATPAALQQATQALKTLQSQRQQVINQLQPLETRLRAERFRLGLSEQQVDDAFRLHSDSSLDAAVDAYLAAQQTLKVLSQDYEKAHPRYLAQVDQLKAVESALTRTAASKVGHAVSVAELRQIQILPGTGQLAKTKTFASLLALKTQQQQLWQQSNQLREQAKQFQAQLRQQQQRTAEFLRLQKAVQTATAQVQPVASPEAIPPSLANAGSVQSYPPLTLLKAPNQPDSPSVPPKELVFLGMGLGTIAIGVGTLLAWLGDRRRWMGQTHPGQRSHLA
jgi:CheY-like chemotaxis protein